jgi:osmotically inducible protein OsmC
MVHGTGITKIVLEVEGVVPGSDQEKFSEIADRAKNICPVSKALTGVPEVSVSAKLVKA